ATQPNDPAESRAPAGTGPGGAAGQRQRAEDDSRTAGDRPDGRGARNPAAGKAKSGDRPRGGRGSGNADEGTKRNRTKGGDGTNPREAGERADEGGHTGARTTRTRG
ncbi:2-oxoglutarate ferredoxin oxidoreductase subunit alpha, partial [Mycobacterium tuberculosis]